MEPTAEQVLMELHGCRARLSRSEDLLAQAAHLLAECRDDDAIPLERKKRIESWWNKANPFIREESPEKAEKAAAAIEKAVEAK